MAQIGTMLITNNLDADSVPQETCNGSLSMNTYEETYMSRSVPCLHELRWHSKNICPQVAFSQKSLLRQVCGERGDMPCVLSPCGGPSCHDSLTLSGDALQKAQEAESMIQNVSSQAPGLKSQVNDIFCCFMCKAVAIKKGHYLEF